MVNKDSQSPVEEALANLAAINPKWRVDVGDPGTESGWIQGRDFLDATGGPFGSLLQRTAIRLETDDRRTVAALFALRFGWVASMAIAPFLVSQCVPRVDLSNISVKFRGNTLFERTAVHEPVGTILASAGRTFNTSIQQSLDAGDLLRVLRLELEQQATPVVDALYKWSGFSRKGSWGMITSSWAAQFITVCGVLSQQMDALPFLLGLFEGEDEIARMKPLLHPVTLRGVTQLYQRRASCCRYYLLPKGDLCASCPLVSNEERLRRNREWMEVQLNRAVQRPKENSE